MSRKDRIYFSFQQNYFIYFNTVLLAYLKQPIPPVSVDPGSALFASNNAHTSFGSTN